MRNAGMDSRRRHAARIRNMNEQEIKRLVQEYYIGLSPRFQSVVLPKDLELFAYAFIMTDQSETFLQDYLVSEFYRMEINPDSLKKTNDFAIAMQGFLNHLTRYPFMISDLPIRYDNHAQSVFRFYHEDNILQSYAELSIKNILNYGLLLMDLGVVTRSDYFAEVPMRTVVHGLALTSMFFVFIFELKFRQWPSLRSMTEASDSIENDNLGIAQYRGFYKHIINELRSKEPARFFKAQEDIINQFNALKKSEKIIRAIPRFYFGALILGPGTIPLILASPLFNLGTNYDEPPGPRDYAICFALAVYFFTFSYFIFSEDVTDFLDQFIYCEKDGCFTEQAQYTAAALGGGVASALTLLMIGLTRAITQLSTPQSQERLVNRLHNMYHPFRRTPGERQRLLINEDVELHDRARQNVSTL